MAKMWVVSVGSDVCLMTCLKYLDQRCGGVVLLGCILKFGSRGCPVLTILLLGYFGGCVKGEKRELR